jgi:hypothetical protein
MPLTLAVLARAELAARALSDSVVVDCVKACTRPEAGSKLPRRVLSAALERLYRIKPSHVQLNAAVAVAYNGKASASRMDRYLDRRQGFEGLAIAEQPGSPLSVYRVWDKLLTTGGLKVGQIQQIVDVWKVARGEQQTNKALEYLQENDWSKFPLEDRSIFEAWYVDGKTTRRIAKDRCRPVSAVWARLSIHQARAGVSPSQGIGAGSNAPEMEPTAKPQPAYFGREGVQVEHLEPERVGGFVVSRDREFVGGDYGVSLAGKLWSR